MIVRYSSTVKLYNGRRMGNQTEVIVDGRSLNLHLDLMELSGGFEWGYCGAGPSQLAVAILADSIGALTAQTWFGRFERDVISHLDKYAWQLNEHVVLHWFDQIAKGTVSIVK